MFSQCSAIYCTRRRLVASTFSYAIKLRSECWTVVSLLSVVDLCGKYMRGNGSCQDQDQDQCLAFVG